MIPVEYWMRQVIAGSLERRGKFKSCFQIQRAEGWSAITIENRPDVEEVSFRGGFVERNANRMRIDVAKIEAMRFGNSQDLGGGPVSQFDANGIEENVSADLVAEPPQAGGQCSRQALNLFRNGFKALRPVVTGVHGSDVRQERLGGADVTGRFVPADVLFPCLQGQAESRLSARIFGHSEDLARHVTL